MGNDVAIRRAVESDAEDIARIYNYAVLNTVATFDTDPKSTQDRVEWLREHNDRYPAFVAEVDGRVVGWASLTAYADRPAYRFTVEDAVYTDCDFQGRGVGTRLMQTLMDAALERGYHAVVALVVGGNQASVKLHEKLGFECVGVMREVGWKFDRWLDILVYERILQAGKQE